MVPFNDLKPLHDALAGDIADAIARVLRRGCYVLGPEVEAFEAAFAAYQGGGHTVAVANGTDAIELALRAAGIGRGDEVVTVAHTAVATVCAIERAGATPVLVDINPETYTMDPDAAAAALTPRTRALLPVHLYGHPADLPALARLAARHRLLLIEDCAQAHGASWKGQKVGTWGELAAFSFYPTKNLGACGDGGAVWTADARLAARLRRLRNYGQTDRYHHAERGINSRLDEVQAAVLSVKLRHLEEHTRARQALAAEYGRLLLGGGLDQFGGVCPPAVREGAEHVYHLYVVRSACRELLREKLAEQGVQTLIHYPVPVHRQPAYADLGLKPGSLPVTEQVCQEVVSLPLFVGLGTAQVAGVVAAIEAGTRRAAA